MPDFIKYTNNSFPTLQTPARTKSFSHEQGAVSTGSPYGQVGSSLVQQGQIQDELASFLSDLQEARFDYPNTPLSLIHI